LWLFHHRVISKAFGPVSGPTSTSQVSRPAPGEHIVQTPSVVNWPVPDPMPVNVIWNESALATAESAKNHASSGMNRKVKRDIVFASIIMAVQAHNFAIGMFDYPLGGVLAKFAGKRQSTAPCQGTVSKVVRQDRCAAFLFGRWFRAGNTAFQELDLAVVVGFVFGDVKPFGVVVRGEVALCNQVG